MILEKKNVKPTYGLTSKKEEVVNIITHAIGIIFSIIAIVLLLQQGAKGSFTYQIGLLVYGLTMFWTYTTSTVYHSLYNAQPQRRNKFHLLDHTAIYLFIAGTYTPIALFVLPGLYSKIVFWGIWAIAAFGLFYKIFLLGRFPKLSLVIYIAMGWFVVVAIKPLLENAPIELLYWIFAGGASYTIGTVFFSLKQLKYSHGIWHLFVLGGTICHFIGINKYV